MITQTPNPHKRLGLTMIVIAWVAVLALVTVVFDDWLNTQHNPNGAVVGEITGEGVREVTLAANRDGHYVAVGSIDRFPVSFILDTGATMVALPGELAERLNLSRGAARQVTTANGVTTAYYTRLGEVALGNIVLKDVAATIIPGMGGNDVLLGMSFLKKLEFLHRADTLILRQHASDR